MNITTQIKVEWDRDTESLPQFKEKFEAFKSHVNRLQVCGSLPRGGVRWLVSKKPQTIPVQVIEAPIMSHAAGEMLT